MKIRHIFFDLDNTLWNHRLNAYLMIKDLFQKENIYNLYNIDFEEFHQKYYSINEELWDKIRDGKITKEYLREHRFYDTFLAFNIDNMELAQRFEHSFLDEILTYNELVEGSIEILEYLSSKNYTLHIISNGFQEVTNRKTELSGIKKYFKTITSADEIGVRKPSPEIFTYALNKANAELYESIMIGDEWISDGIGAKNFGLKCIFLDVFGTNQQEENIINIKKLTEIKNLL